MANHNIPIDEDDITVNENHPGEYAMRAGHNQEGGTMDIGEAVMEMKSGLKVTRDGWNGRNMWLELQVPDDNSKMTLPYVYMKTVKGDLVPWLCSQTDLLATDWRAVP